VKGFVQRTPVWLVRPLGLDTVRKQASAIEVETRRFYERAAAHAQDASIRQLLDDLAQEERSHEDRAQELTEEKLRPDVKDDEDKARRRLFVLQIVQPGLAGLMDGSVSTLAPVFAAALATKNSWDAFLVGMAASLGAGISMGFAEALSDDGSLTGRGHPWVRGGRVAVRRQQSCGLIRTGPKTCLLPWRTAQRCCSLTLIATVSASVDSACCTSMTQARKGPGAGAACKCVETGSRSLPTLLAGAR
jgi:rubrerythrin